MKKILNALTGATLKSKLTAFLIAMVVLIGVVFFAISALITRTTLHNQIDHHIHIVVLEAQRVVESYSGKERLEILRNLVSSQGMTVVLLSTDGSPILQTNSPDVAAVSEHQLQKIMIESSFAQEPEHFTVDTIRFATLPVDLETGQGVLAVGYSTLIVNQTQQVLLISLGGTLLIVLLISVLLIIHLLNKLLNPLTIISQTALSITDSKELTKRVAPLPQTNELKSIALAINTMLARLQSVFHSEYSFFADAAHTLKTPLAVLRSQIEANQSLSHQAKNKAFKVIDQAAETIKQLILISQIETQTIEKEPLSLSNLLQQLVELAETLANTKKVDINSNLEPNITITGNKTLLTRALSNIIKNAIEHTQQGAINIKLKQTATKIIITINDTGEGIKQADLTDIYDRFYQGNKNNKNGTGLGLAIAKAVLNKHQAKIKVNSKVNQGTNVTITFPQ